MKWKKKSLLLRASEDFRKQGFYFAWLLTLEPLLNLATLSWTDVISIFIILPWWLLKYKIKKKKHAHISCLSSFCSLKSSQQKDGKKVHSAVCLTKCSCFPGSWLQNRTGHHILEWELPSDKGLLNHSLDIRHVLLLSGFWRNYWKILEMLSVVLNRCILFQNNVLHMWGKRHYPTMKKLMRSY